jgi:sugar phosphate isomerase/epimerase
MFRTGLNPYGLTYTLGLQGANGPRANPRGRGLEGFLQIAAELGARSIEIHNAWLVPLEVALGARIIRTPLTPVLCGDRSARAEEWPNFVRSAREKLKTLARLAEREGVTVAIENHQDFTSRELLDFCDEAGANVGICFDTGNTFPVAEAPLDFARRVARRVRHVHFKDYRAHWTDEGIRLVRCAIGDGAVPFQEIAALLAQHHKSLTASLEPGALEARHVRLFTAEWWRGYAPSAASDLAACLQAARRNRLADDADWRTPWERNEDGESVIRFETEMIRRSASNMKSIGLMQ